MEIDFKGKRVLITGAGKGIGRCCVKTLVKCRAKVVALSRNKADLDSLKEEFPEVETVCVDLSDWKKTRQLVETVLPIDLLVNIATLLRVDGDILTVTEKHLDEMFTVNLKAVVNVTQVVVNDLIKRKVPSSSIVNVSSFVSTHPMELGVTSYACSKGALDTFTRQAALEFGAHGIRVNSINPCTIKTQKISDFLNAIPELRKILDKQIARIPLKRLAEEQDVVDEIVHLLSDRSKMISGQLIHIDGGYSVS